MAGGDGETVTVRRPPPKGKFGDPGTGDTVEFTIDGVLFAPGGSGENNTAANSVDTQAQLYITDPGVDVRPADQVLARGGVWEVIGDTAVWGRFGAVVSLRKFTG